MGEMARTLVFTGEKQIEKQMRVQSAHGSRGFIPE